MENQIDDVCFFGGKEIEIMDLQEQVADKLGKYMDFKQQMARAQMLLERKYHEKFEIERYVGQEVMDSFYAVIAYAEEFPYLLFRAYVEVDVDEVSDEYVGKRIAHRMAEAFMQILDKADRMYYVHVVPMDFLFLTDDPTVDLANLYQIDISNRYTIYVFCDIGNENKKEVYRDLYSMLQIFLHISGNIELYSTEEKEIEAIQGYIETNEQIFDDFKHFSEKYFIGVIPFAFGKMCMDETAFLKMAGDKI